MPSRDTNARGLILGNLFKNNNLFIIVLAPPLRRAPEIRHITRFESFPIPAGYPPVLRRIFRTFSSRPRVAIRIIRRTSPGK